ncbi:MAG TPA: ribbon-helix-helix domain-containing protein [Candidatus Lokiarchaeia archaeon]|nr:ribbon-helix-helix domain-containing protein [Candidatus Lokiarchaeia archaeon]
MKVITCFFPESYVDILEKLVADGHFPNRSEAIRVAVRDLIKVEYEISLRTADESESEGSSIGLGE